MSGLMLTSMVAGNTVIIEPTAGNESVAIVWIHGMQCKPEHYEALAKEVQSQAAPAGYKLWVGIPEFAFDAPEPILIDHYVQDTIS
jgi:hypothetical protein